MAGDGYKLVAQNKKAYHDYFIDQKFEAGLVLAGTEVKSMRMGQCSIKESFVKVVDNEIYSVNMHVTPYEKGNIFNKDPVRMRKLLLNRFEIDKISSQVAIKGYTIVPLKVYLKKGRMKMEIGLARGKKNYDKRQDIAKKDQKRTAEKQFKIQNL